MGLQSRIPRSSLSPHVEAQILQYISPLQSHLLIYFYTGRHHSLNQSTLLLASYVASSCRVRQLPVFEYAIYKDEVSNSSYISSPSLFLILLQGFDPLWSKCTDHQLTINTRQHWNGLQSTLSFRPSSDSHSWAKSLISRPIMDGKGEGTHMPATPGDQRA
jgi:hypothetical protein